jgi:hypothetical protein
VGGHDIWRPVRGHHPLQLLGQPEGGELRDMDELQPRQQLMLMVSRAACEMYAGSGYVQREQMLL